MKVGTLYYEIDNCSCGQECEVALSCTNGEYKTVKIKDVVHKNGKVILITDNTKMETTYRQYFSAMED